MNVELLYDFSLLLMHPGYEGFDLAANFWLSGMSAIEPRHRLQVVAIDHRSPLALVAVIPLAVAGAAGVWAIVQTFEKIANFRLNRRKLKAEVKKVEAEAAAATLQYERLLDERKAKKTAEQLTTRIKNAPLRLIEGELGEEPPAA